MFPSESEAKMFLILVEAPVLLPLKKNVYVGIEMNAMIRKTTVRCFRNWKYRVIPTP
jgi:hypothetical protein